MKLTGKTVLSNQENHIFSDCNDPFILLVYSLLSLRVPEYIVRLQMRRKKLDRIRRRLHRVARAQTDVAWRVVDPLAQQLLHRHDALCCPTAVQSRPVTAWCRLAEAALRANLLRYQRKCTSPDRAIFCRLSMRHNRNTKHFCWSTMPEEAAETVTRTVNAQLSPLFLLRRHNCSRKAKQCLQHNCNRLR